MSDAAKPLRKGDQVTFTGGMFTHLIATVERVDWLESGKKYALRVPGITCPLQYAEGDLLRTTSAEIPDVGRGHA